MTKRGKVYAGKQGRWDETRNTSRVHSVSVGDGRRVAEFLRMMANEEWYRWIAGGRPVYTESEYAQVRKTGAPCASTPPWTPR